MFEDNSSELSTPHLARVLDFCDQLPKGDKA